MGIFRRHKKVTESEEATKSDPHEESAARGPFDVSSAPESERIDFGALQLPRRDDVDIAVEVDPISKRATGLALTHERSVIQVNAFAAPKSSGLWDEVRASLRESIGQQGGTTEVREGEFGSELHARVPVNEPNSTVRRHRPLRFVGIDGPRWFLRAVISGAALGNEEAAASVNELIRSLVVVRGSLPMAPKELIEIVVPDSARDANSSQGPTVSDIDPEGEGPSLAVVG